MSRRPIQIALLFCLFAMGGACDGTFSQSASDGDGVPNPGGDEGEESCFVDADCSLVASSCCGCPTFATTADFDSTCEDVECPMQVDCAPAAAVCSEGRCALVCSPVTATQVCEGGFLVDEAGCTLDECVAELAPECSDDLECVIVPADCCGCELGGNDTAVPVSGQDDHLGSLMCEGPISCPGVSSCEETARTACLGGKCRYLTGVGTDSPPVLCGTLETGSCPDDQVCVLNSMADGTVPGVGVCQAQ